MCDFGEVKRVTLTGAGKTSQGWFTLADAQVYHDHFIKARVEEGLVIDLLNESDQNPVHVCLELDASSARELAKAILDTVESLEQKRGAVVGRISS